ncbi:MAG: hypothetical protein K6U87_14455 [Firmicutes bacterium]|nr:hypothetical protein [Bacillota bacterium]
MDTVNSPIQKLWNAYGDGILVVAVLAASYLLSLLAMIVVLDAWRRWKRAKAPQLPEWKHRAEAAWQALVNIAWPLWLLSFLAIILQPARAALGMRLLAALKLVIVLAGFQFGVLAIYQVLLHGIQHPFAQRLLIRRLPRPWRRIRIWWDQLDQ